MTSSTTNTTTTDSHDDDYAAFLAEAQANDVAFRSRWARREQAREHQWASSNLAGLPQQSFKAPTQRDSAYYSVASVSPSSASGPGPQKRPPRGRWSAPVPASGSGSGPVPASPPTLEHNPSRTLGRRISEYFKPSPSAGMSAVA
ncbi:uncharacterized protein MAM_07096 [Metarhizium album ARSEF 1941]|uniref:Uncharacterized protein n=1 Tax=Metarhizium album (strain ARSEF 1941) TaxID=1081103 RepID=A0A0B2WNI1_METAS|nr:uncharacterized protein MAM_07096 [Metarhizium album ARSEF 1941]KHN95047.1 hypothetical protein MAM_07096 [Metarhizium album ARSEF 1941]